RLDQEAIARLDDQPGLLGLDRARRLTLGVQHVAVRRAVLAAQDAAGAVLHAVARGVADGGLGDLGDHFEHAARAAAILAVAARVGAELVLLEEQREAHLGDLEAAELDAAGGLPLAGARPAVARGRRTAARPRLEEMPDE